MSCSRRTGSGPAASRHVASTVSVGTRTARARAAGPGRRTARQYLAVAGLRHQRHQQRRPQRRRHRHRPPGGALDLPPWNHLRRDLADRAGLPGHRIQLLLDDPEPGVVSGMPACLDPPVAAHHRRGDRQRLEEHHHVARADLRTLCRQRGPLPFPQRPAQRRRRSATRTATIPAPARAGRPPVRDGSGSSGKRHGRVQRHEGLRGPEGRQQPLLLPGVPPESPQPRTETSPRVAPQATCASTAAARLRATARTPVE